MRNGIPGELRTVCRGGVQRLAIVAICATWLCACRGVMPEAGGPAGLSPPGSTTPSSPQVPPMPGQPGNIAPYQAAMIAPASYQADAPSVMPESSVTPGIASPQAVVPGIPQAQLHGLTQSCPCEGSPYDVETGCRPWTPPGISSPWPDDEYLCDGGDHNPAVRVRSDWSVIGLDLEDTVVHYDTLDGETHVEPSNRVCIYAPRFAAVRRVHGLAVEELHQRIAGLEQPVPLEGVEDIQIATTTVQPVQPALHRDTASASAFRDRLPSIQLENRQGIVGMTGDLLPYEAPAFIRHGMVDNSEKARLSQAALAAAAWTADQAVQVVIDNVAVQEGVSLAQAESLYIYEVKGKSRLRVCKMASRPDARPGETVEFTIRFDNVGDRTIGNVTVIDNLTTRLEYVDGSQQCSLPAEFGSAENQGESLVLRWEIEKPLKVSEGGVIRFQCRVR
jgi:uncharacterized repeat protein (TIGR01451 family)